MQNSMLKDPFKIVTLTGQLAKNVNLGNQIENFKNHFMSFAAFFFCKVLD